MADQIRTFCAETRTGNFFLTFTRLPDGLFICPCGGRTSEDPNEMWDHVENCRLGDGILEYKRLAGRALRGPGWEARKPEVIIRLHFPTSIGE